MAKNRVATDRPKMKDSFFKKSRSNFHKVKFQHKNRKEESKPVPGANSNNFFIKSDSAEASSKPNTPKVHNYQEKNESNTEKKPFDKKKYRLQKYSKKYQLQQWEDKRKKAVLHSYYKTLKEDQFSPRNKIHEDSANKTDAVEENEKNGINDEKILDIDKSNEPEDAHPNISKGQRTKPFRKAHQEFQRIKEEKEKKKEQLLKKKMEKEEALQKYKQKKVEKFKKLNKKTKKGQPIMKDRMEMLLEKIQNSIEQD